jgi:hypothetical protein
VHSSEPLCRFQFVEAKSLNTKHHFALVALSGLVVVNARGAHLEASDGTADDLFGRRSVGSAGGNALVGAESDDISAANQGSVYFFPNVADASGTVMETAKLTASDGAGADLFGYSVALRGRSALIGAAEDDLAYSRQGSAYLFRNLGAAGSVTQTAKLVASDGRSSSHLGTSVSLDGAIGLVGAAGDTIGGINGNVSQGSAYVFRGLDTATGTITQSAKLLASGGAASDSFGVSVSLSGTIGLVGATGRSSAYVFRNLHSVTGTRFHDAQLVPAGGATSSDFFGNSVSLSGNMGLVGAWGRDESGITDQGAAYVFRNLDSAVGGVTEAAKLLASDGAALDSLGRAVSVSGSDGLVGAYYDTIGANVGQGSVYLFRDLDTATGLVTEALKFFASDGVQADRFGISVALEGDVFVAGVFDTGSPVTDVDKAYSGSISSFTTLDDGHAARIIDGISFESRGDWVIGGTTDLNQATLSAGDSGAVNSPGRGVYIGRDAGSDENTLIIHGTLSAGAIHVGSLAGNSGNTFRLESSAPLQAASIKLAPGNFLVVPGDQTAPANLLDYLGTTDLELWNASGGAWDAVTLENVEDLTDSVFSNGHTTVFVSGTAPAPVQCIVVENDQLILRWRVAGSEGWSLQESANLEDWGDSTTDPEAIGNSWRVATSPVSPDARFFRLIKP